MYEVNEISTERSVERNLNFSLFDGYGVDFYIKRDDLIHPVVSGNKWRKLNLQLTDARENNKTELLTFGGAYSNHVVATAFAGSLYGFKTTAFMRGEEVREKNNYDLICDQYGMKQIKVSRESYRDKKVLFEKYSEQNEGCYFIDEGGAGLLGEKGCEVIVDELQNNYDFICLPVGTATTAKGISDACERKKLQTKVLGFSVMKNNKSLDDKMNENGFLNSEIFHQFSRGGYGKTDSELIDFIDKFTTETGILADKIYLGKMLMGITSLLAEGYFKKGSKILILHTGGSPRIV
ncbi:MAG: pyridoxal-phosphate dependent enzyme [Bacteroidia bacterium]|nr:pyridoxal-phosphate dependent enzyme [Bacteroidia bacterium]